MATYADTLADEAGRHVNWRRLTLALAGAWVPAWYLQPATPAQATVWGIGLTAFVAVVLLVLAVCSLVLR